MSQIQLIEEYLTEEKFALSILDNKLSNAITNVDPYNDQNKTIMAASLERQKQLGVVVGIQRALDLLKLPVQPKERV